MNSRCTLATMYGIGLVKRAPGTVGSAAAALLAYGILKLPYGWELLSAGVVLFTILGTQSATRYMREQGSDHDPKEIVIDELVGQWLTFCIWYWVSHRYIGAHPKIEVFLIIGFLSFRFFDIVKPWPISWADRKIKGGFGVMFDDLLAAIPAGLLIAFLTIYAAFMVI